MAKFQVFPCSICDTCCVEETYTLGHMGADKRVYLKAVKDGAQLNLPLLNNLRGG